MNGQQIAKTVLATLDKNAPTILTGVGAAGVISTSVLAAVETPKAMRAIEKADAEKGEPLTRMEMVKTAAPCYIPAALNGALSIACIIFSHKMSMGRYAALAAAYSLTETSYKEFREKASEFLTEHQEQKVLDEIAKDHVLANPPKESTIITVGNKTGQTLCYDSVSGRYFMSDIEVLRKAEHCLNKRLMDETWVSLNTLYDMIELDPISIGDDLGWDVMQDGLIDMGFSSCLTDDGTPCLTINLRINPRRRYYYGE